MAEAIAAFSLAANVLQFIDIGSRMVGTLWSYYKSNRKGSKQAPDLLRISTDLQHVLQGFQVPATGAHEDVGLAQLARDCQAVAEEMQNLLQSVFHHEAGSMGKREALLAALKMVWKEDDLQSLQDRLNQFRHQLVVHLLASLREQAHKSLNQQQAVLETLKTVREGTQRLEGKVERMAVDKDGMGSLLLDFLVVKAGLKGNEDAKSHLKREFMTEIYSSKESEVKQDQLSPSISNTRREGLRQVFLAKLHYAGTEDREMRVAEAHEATYRWIFEDRQESQKPWSSFKEWSRSDSQLYWLTGKAGSGKSTLMKYICRTKEEDQQQFRHVSLLGPWAMGNKLVVALFFFWNSGISLQMMQAGLLRTLLYQILQAIPDLVPLVSPKRWESLCLFNEDNVDWTVHELRNMLRSVGMNLGDNTKLCLFVDGLDEFDGEPRELITLFRDLLKNPRIKLCVASRPWVVFEDAFREEASLMLQNLTYPDIKQEPSYAAALVEKIVIKSSGVFLWVRIVVQSLLSGLGHGDRVSDLERRLDSLPPDLEDLYNKILSSLDPFYLEHAAQYFKLVEESSDPITVPRLAYADEAEQFEKIIDLQVQESSDEELEMLFETTRRRLNSRCKGFLEVPVMDQNILDVSGGIDVRNSTVQYLHRTVKDSVRSPAVQQKLQSAMVQPFDPHFSFCVGNLALLKTMNQSKVSLQKGDVFWTYVTRFMMSASRLSAPYRGHLLTLMDDLDKSGSILAKIAAQKAHWTSDYSKELMAAGQWVVLHPIRELSQHFGGHFLSLAAAYGIDTYVQAKASKGCLTQIASFININSPLSLCEISRSIRSSVIHPLLLDTLCFLGIRGGIPKGEAYAIEQPSISMIKCLLEKEADPNAAYEDMGKTSTVWEFAKSAYADDQHPLLDPKTLLSAYREWLEKRVYLFELMIQYGAGDYSRRRRKAILEQLESSQNTLKSQRVMTQPILSDIEHYLFNEVLKLDSAR